ncbi:hypothetical protein D3C73_1294900 [compost metagenome]
MIVVGKIIHRNQIDTGFLLRLQMLKLNFSHLGKEILLIYFAGPVGLQRFFPLAVFTDSRVPQIAGCNLVCHDILLLIYPFLFDPIQSVLYFSP